MAAHTVASAIAACIERCAEAQNGHHRRWARERLKRRLVDDGTGPCLAGAVADAADAVGRVLADGQQRVLCAARGGLQQGGGHGAMVPVERGGVTPLGR